MSPRAAIFCACLSKLSLAQWPLWAGEAYVTSFESPPYKAGVDAIAGTDGWIGSTAHAGKGLSGVLSESQHGVSGIGNAAYLGGNSARITGVGNKSVHLRRPVNLDPLALGREIVSFSVVFGIKDSTAFSSFRRDDFEFLVYNNSGQLLAGIQFDNSTLDSATGLPQRIIYLLYWNGSQISYANTGYTYLPETLELLEFRINLRTNRWSVTLGGAPLFQDVPFHEGPYARTLGFVLAQMQVGNTFPFSTDIHPGDNYMLFDDYRLRADPVTLNLAMSWTDAGDIKLDWNEEYGYQYRLQYSQDIASWHDFPETVHTATRTGVYSFTDPVRPRPAMRFFRVRHSYP